MTNEIGNEIWKYSKKAMNRYGRGSAVGLDLGSTWALRCSSFHSVASSSCCTPRE
jgi:hypothetical protein